LAWMLGDSGRTPGGPAITDSGRNRSGLREYADEQIVRRWLESVAVRFSLSSFPLA
jgi:hypothetical protein